MTDIFQIDGIQLSVWKILQANSVFKNSLHLRKITYEDLFPELLLETQQ